MIIKRLLFTSAFLVVLSANAMSVSKEVEAFRDADRDSDKQLNWSEFKVFIQKLAKGDHPKAKKAVRYGALGYSIAFSDVDANGDKLVTPAELEAMR